ncbi:MAG: RNA 3'-terminal phosphate cyclase [Archangium sp.]
MAGADRHDGPVELDGSEGEGGGQILRSALSLSLITGRPFHMTRVRANRQPPGLRPQHLACVRGAEALSGGRSEGAAVGASELRFEPGPVRPGDYVLEVGTAGSTPLLFQCLFYPLALAGGGSLTLRGGTHLPHSPSFHYLVGVWLPVVRAYGLNASLRLVHAGFYPEGTGEFIAEVDAVHEPPTRVELPARGTGDVVAGRPIRRDSSAASTTPSTSSSPAPTHPYASAGLRLPATSVSAWYTHAAACAHRLETAGAVNSLLCNSTTPASTAAGSSATATSSRAGTRFTARSGIDRSPLGLNVSRGQSFIEADDGRGEALRHR